MTNLKYDLGMKLKYNLIALFFLWWVCWLHVIRWKIFIMK